MQDAGGGEGASAERFAALVSHAKLPEPLAADAQELLQALTPCVAAYDASEEAQQPLVRAAAAPRSSWRWRQGRIACPNAPSVARCTAPRRAHRARALTRGAWRTQAERTLFALVLFCAKAHYVGPEPTPSLSDLSSFTDVSCVPAPGRAPATPGLPRRRVARPPGRRIGAHGAHYGKCESLQATRSRAPHAAFSGVRDLCAAGAATSRTMRPALQRPGACAARRDADNFPRSLMEVFRVLPAFLAYAAVPLLERYGEGVEARLKVRRAAPPRRAPRRRALRSVRSSGSHALLRRTHRPQLNPLRRSLAFSFVLAEKYRVRGRARRLRSWTWFRCIRTQPGVRPD